MSEFAMQPPCRKILLPQPVADFLERCQFDAFTGRIVLHMHEGHVKAVEPHHAPMDLAKLTAKLAKS